MSAALPLLTTLWIRWSAQSKFDVVERPRRKLNRVLESKELDLRWDKQRFNKDSRTLPVTEVHC